MFTDPQLLILDEPTRGIDVGAKYEIYGVIQRLAQQGRGVIVISSELPELLGLCDRIYTLAEGRITHEFTRAEADQESLMRYMTKSNRTRGRTMNSMKGLLRGNVRQYGMVIALVAIVVFFQVPTDGVLLRPLNVTNLLTQNASILILAIGMVMVIIARHIDLSVGSVAAFVGAVAAIMMTKCDVPWLIAVILCLALGAAIGAWHGFWVAYVGIPAFIVTLSSMLLFRGLTLVVLEGATVGELPKGFEAMGNGFLPEVGLDTGLST